MLFAKDHREFSPRRGHLHNLNLGKIPAIAEAVPELPFEIITEVLSWLPVKSLLRFKIVCKQWCSLLPDYNFIEKHMLRATPMKLSYQLEWKPNNNGAYVCRFDKNFNCVTRVAGLFLERSLANLQHLRIRNFATRRVLYFPHAHNAVKIMGFVFDSSTGECKVACFYKNKEGEFGHEVGFKVRSIGKDDEWRTLKLPNKNNTRVLKRHNIMALPDEGVAHSIEIIQVGENLKIQVVSFDIWSECFTFTSVPHGVFADLQRVSIIPWIETIAVVDMVGEALNVLVLQDLKEHKWSKMTLPLKFLKDDPILKDQIQPLSAVTFEELQFNNAVSKNIILYDMKREMIKGFKATVKKSVENFEKVKPSLVSLKGMVKED